jgi:hypothetical protein
MYVLPILPDEIPEPLTEGVTAYLRPLDHGELAALLDTWPASADGNLPIAAAPWLVKRQLLRIDGLAMGAEGVAFDTTNAVHMAALPWSWVQQCARALYARMNLSESSAKNSDAPSVLVVPTAGVA